MISQALEITSRPLKWEFEIESARLQMKQSDNPVGKLDISDPSLRIDSKNIEVRLDGTELRASLNQRTMDEYTREAARQGRTGAQRATREAAEFGNQMAHIEDGVTIPQLVQQKMLEQPDTYTMFIPAPYNISWQPNEQSLDFEPADVEIDWEVAKNLMEYTPGSFSINILQKPEVEIKYLGEPRYVPPSSAPGFDATA